MMNSVSFNPVRSLGGVLPNDRGSVTVDGKTYPVKKVPIHSPLKSTFAPVYCDVVMINGKSYPVEKVTDWTACDKTKDVVIVNGKTYDVKKHCF